MINRRSILKFIPAALLPASLAQAAAPLNTRAIPREEWADTWDGAASPKDSRLTIGQRKFIDNLAFIGLSTLAAGLRPTANGEKIRGRGRSLDKPVKGDTPWGICLRIPMEFADKPLAHAGLIYMHPAAVSIAEVVLDLQDGQVYELGFDYNIEGDSILGYLYASQGTSTPAPGFRRHRTLTLANFGIFRRKIEPERLLEPAA